MSRNNGMLQGLYHSTHWGSKGGGGRVLSNTQRYLPVQIGNHHEKPALKCLKGP